MGGWEMSTSRRLSQVFKSSKEIPFDDSSKFIFFSDCHRGDNSWADDFAHNQNLLFTALNHYFNEGFTYIEIGDGEELWENRNFSEIRQSHSHIFWMMRKFYMKKRLYMIWGNHDMVKKHKRFVEKNLYRYYDERKEKYKPLFDKIEVYEGLILKYAGTDHKIFIFHGHQGDLFNDRLWWFNRFIVRYIWRPLELLGFNDPTGPAKNYEKKSTNEENIIKWVKDHKQMVIAGHSHRPAFPNVGDPLYFNDGSCIHPRCITGVEIQNGEIMMIKWSVNTKNDGTLYVEREIIEGPQKLHSFFYDD